MSDLELISAILAKNNFSHSETFTGQHFLLFAGVGNVFVFDKVTQALVGLGTAEKEQAQAPQPRVPAESEWPSVAAQNRSQWEADLQAQLKAKGLLR